MKTRFLIRFQHFHLASQLEIPEEKFSVRPWSFPALVPGGNQRCQINFSHEGFNISSFSNMH